MKCDYCGYNNPNENAICLACGAKLNKGQINLSQILNGGVELGSDNHIEPEHVESPLPEESIINPKAEKPHRKLVPIIIVSIVLVAIVGFIVSKNPIAYAKANGYLSSGQYENAIQAFTELIDYKNSKMLLQESKYQLAQEKVAEKQYSEANVIFSELGEYKDSVSFRKESSYLLGEQLIADGKLQEAASIYSGLSGYKDVDSKILEINYLLAKAKIDEKKFAEAIGLLENQRDYKDSGKLLLESKYNLGMDDYNMGKFESAKGYFTGLQYQDSERLLKKINLLLQLQGTWHSTNPFHNGELFFSGWYYFREDDANRPGSYDVVEISKGKVYSDSISIFTSISGVNYLMTYFDAKTSTVIEDMGYGITMKYKKNSEEITNSSIRQFIASGKTIDSANAPLLEPQIGMTAEEVRNSTWGLPKEINKTTTAYGVNEQWVYDGYKYIYLENGIVTAIQE